MNMVTKVACRSAGTLGMGVALYEAVRVGGHFSKTESEDVQSRYIANAMYNSRTLDNMSYTSNSIREKTFNLRTKNPLPAIYGRVKGAIEGFLYGLGNTLPLIACSALAILGKNTLAKTGVVGLGCCLLYKIARDGYGLGKNNPMN